MDVSGKAARKSPEISRKNMMRLNTDSLPAEHNLRAHRRSVAAMMQQVRHFEVMQTPGKQGKQEDTHACI